jgi:hypothetical protein
MVESGTSDVEAEALNRFPELKDFVVELQGNDGRWSDFRAAEDERVAAVLKSPDSVLHMLSGGYATVDVNGVRTNCRFTPKSWLRNAS